MSEKPWKCAAAACVLAMATPAIAEEVTAEIWVDNWFALHVNGEKVAEDSVAYKTERSFNAETIRLNADLPMTVAVELRDFMENDTGLEYIGSRKQQMGDGGAILQFSAGGKVIGVSDANWKCDVIHHAPVQTSCAKSSDPQIWQGACAGDITDAPADWTSVDFDDSGWDNAIEHSESAVRPKDGYDRISWDGDAKIIWSEDLERDNIVLCRATIG